MDNNNRLLYNNGSVWEYASSTSANWIWAPSLFVSAWIAYYYGVVGLLCFTVPNFLTLILFGFLADYAINKRKMSGFTFNDVLVNTRKHSIVIYVQLRVWLKRCFKLMEKLQC